VSETNNFVGVSKPTAWLTWRIEGRSHVFLARKTGEGRPARFVSDGEQILVGDSPLRRSYCWISKELASE
jgi:hypothetical protein